MSFRKARDTFFKLPVRKAILQVSLNVGNSCLLPCPVILWKQLYSYKNLRIKKVPKLNKFSFIKAYYTMNYTSKKLPTYMVWLQGHHRPDEMFVSPRKLLTLWKCYEIWKISCKNPNFHFLIKIWKVLQLWPPRSSPLGQGISSLACQGPNPPFCQKSRQFY